MAAVRMKLAMAILLVMPVVLIAWLGWRTTRLERERLQDRLREAALQRLDERAARLSSLIEGVETELDAVLEAIQTPDGLPPRFHPALRHRFVRQVFACDAAGELRYPHADDSGLTDAERGFLERTAAIWTAGGAFALPDEQEIADASATSRTGWQTWFLDDGMHFLYWRRALDGTVRGIEVDRHALVAAAIAALPATDSHTSSRARALPESIHLLDARGYSLYQWGDYRPPEGVRPLATLPLPSPWAGWALALREPPLSPDGFSPAAAALLLAVLAVVIAMGAAAVVVVREHGRAMREAGQRVSFVNQVSHELKTPLTNIRLYAELLETRLPPDDGKAAHYLRIVTAESQRLSRMVGNVLTFARQQRRALRIRPEADDANAAVADVLAQFQPALERKRMRVTCETRCPPALRFDRDVIEQVLGNLLGNVEKYVGEGASVAVTAAIEGDRLTVSVADSGPGIPAAARERVFDPFYRLDGRLTEGVSGTGIGLSIARSLCRLHGGDLTLEPAASGATFKATFKVTGGEA